MRRVPIAVGLALAAGVACGCGSIDRAPQIANPPPIEIPSAWLDLPDSPFAASHIGPRAVLVGRSSNDISEIAVGCVKELDGRVSVVSPLWITSLGHGAWTHGSHMTGVLEDISKLYRDGELYAPSSPKPPRPCPVGSFAAITQASSRTNFKWSAEGTRWPQGPPHDTRNTWRLSAKTPPTFQYVNARGCFDIDVYAANKLLNEVIWVRLDLNRKKLPTAKRPLVVKLTDSVGVAKVQIHVYQTDWHDWICSDVSRWDSEQPTTWLPRRGTLRVWAVPGKKDFEYPVTIQIEDAEFVGPGGATIRPPQTILIKTLAGRMVGG